MNNKIFSSHEISLGFILIPVIQHTNNIGTFNNRIDLMRDSLVLFMIPPARTGHAERYVEDNKRE